MLVTKRNLIIIHRGPDYERDFDEIATKVNALDRDITVYHLPAALRVDLPVSAWQYPTLTVALTPRFRLTIRRGPVLRNEAIQKLAQQEIFRKHGIPTPPALPFRFGMTLDPILFGDLVVLKPVNLQLTSHGDGIMLFRRRRVELLRPRELPRDHPLLGVKSDFLVQKYVHTGRRPRCIRVGTFLQRAIFSYEVEPVQELPGLDASDEFLQQASVASNCGERERRLVAEDDAILLAEAAHRAAGSVPLLGVDIIRDTATKKLYVLELNAGGNTWHFSSDLGTDTRISLGCPGDSNGDASSHGRQALIQQFGAFDIAARALVERTRELAS